MIHLNFLDLELHPDGVHGVRAQGARHILTQQAGLPNPRVTEQNYLQSEHLVIIINHLYIKKKMIKNSSSSKF